MLPTLAIAVSFRNTISSKRVGKMDADKIPESFLYDLTNRFTQTPVDVVIHFIEVKKDGQVIENALSGMVSDMLGVDGIKKTSCRLCKAQANRFFYP